MLHLTSHPHIPHLSPSCHTSYVLYPGTLCPISPIPPPASHPHNPHPTTCIPHPHHVLWHAASYLLHPTSYILAAPSLSCVRNLTYCTPQPYLASHDLHPTSSALYAWILHFMSCIPPTPHPTSCIPPPHPTTCITHPVSYILAFCPPPPLAAASLGDADPPKSGEFGIKTQRWSRSQHMVGVFHVPAVRKDLSSCWHYRGDTGATGMCWLGGGGGNSLGINPSCRDEP